MKEKVYKFEIKSKSGEIFLKADPYAFYFEARPKSASVVYDINRYRWYDSEWLEMRSEKTGLNLLSLFMRFTSAPGCVCRRKKTVFSLTESLLIN